MHHFLIAVLLYMMMRYMLAYALKYTGNWLHSLLQRRGTWWLGFRGRRETFYFLDILLFPLNFIKHVQFSSVQSLSRVRLFSIPWIAARQASLSITISRSSLRLTSIESVMPSSHLMLGRPLLLLPPIPPSIRLFSNESTLHVRWPKYWSFSFSIIPSKEIPGLIFRMDWLDLLAVQGTLKNLLQHHIQKHQFFGAQPSSQSNSHIHTWPLEKP